MRSMGGESRISVENLKEARELLKYNQHRPSTKYVYHKVWTNFNDFVIKLDYPPDAWEERVSLYCAYLTINTDIQSSTLRSYVSAIKSKLTADDYKWNQDLVYLSALICGCKLKNDIIKVRLPISKHLLEIILFETERKYTLMQKSPYKSAMYKTAYISLYYGLLRVGEITQSQHAVKAVDVHDARNKNKYLFILHSSKTHSIADRPQRIAITQDEDAEFEKSSFSPVEEIDNYISIQGCRFSDTELFFIDENRCPMQANVLRNELRSILTQIGLKAELYDVHSFRIGRATDLYKKGKPIEKIQELGRWRSNAVYKYLKF